jgi:hypothetical protein
MTLFAAAALVLVGGALVAGSGLVRLPSVVPPVPAPSVVAVAPTPSSSEPAPPSASPIPVAGPGGVWIAVASMVTPRFDNAAVQLLDGRVLVVGGVGHALDPTTAEVYDPASGTWSATGSMLKARFGFLPTLLPDGRVLVGYREERAAESVTLGFQVYDPERGTWSSAGNEFTSRSGVADGFTATMLRDGKVLVAGPTGAQVFDPDRGAWSATGTMITPRHDHTATLLKDGKVLVVGGRNSAMHSCDEVGCGYPAADGNELYDPDTGSWTAIAKEPAEASGRFGWWASLLQDGTLLLIGDTVSLYDPASRTWSTRAAPPEDGYPKALLPDDTVLLAVEGDSCTAAAIYDPRTGSTTSASSMRRCISAFGQPPLFTPLRDGTVLASGGTICEDDGDGVCVAVGAAEVYVPAGVPLPQLPAFPSPAPPVFPSPTPLPPADGPVPLNARSWTVTVDNRSSEPASLFVAGDEVELVGSATPNVVPAGTTIEVSLLFPADDDGWIYVNPRPGEGGSLVNADQIGIPGKIVITEEGQVGWLSP